VPDDHDQTPRYTRYTRYEVTADEHSRRRGLWLGVWSAAVIVTLLVAAVGFGRSWWWGVAVALVWAAGAVMIAFGVGAARWIALVAVICVAAIGGAAVGWAQKTIAVVETRNPETVAKVRKELVPELPGEATNILVLGSDHRYQFGGEAGRSDTLMLLRLDPKTKSISMLSVPRDLQVEIPGYGSDRINTAYSTGGPPLSLKTFKAVTGLPVNHFMEVDFVGFSNIVDALGGVYLDVDRKYYNPPNSGYAAIDIPAGYQRLNGHDALQFARYRHTDSDFVRMVRQQTLIRELKRQSFRWDNWRRIPRLVEIVTRNTTSDMSKLKDWLSLARLILEVDTSKVYTTHLVGDGIMVNGASMVAASPEQIAAQFKNPDKPPVQPPQGKKMKQSTFVVAVSNGGAPAGTAGSVAAALKGEGYRTRVAGDLEPAQKTTDTLVYATRSFIGNARAVAALMPPARVVELERGSGTVAGVSVVVGSSYDGSLAIESDDGAGSTGYGMVAQQGVNQDAPMWRQMATGTQVKVQMPTAWVAGYSYEWDQSRKYKIPTGDGDRAAVCVVGSLPSGKYFHIQEMRWVDPPAIVGPDETQTVGDIDYKLFYDGAKLSRVAWQDGNTLYWVANTLENDIPKPVLLALAKSFKPVK
jgi:LCP family protein required for cell wall assembly